MKIIQINAVYGEKSTGVIVKDIQQIAEENGIECYIGYQKAKESVPKGIRIGNPIDWKLHALYTRFSGKQGYGSRLATKKFIKELDEIKPDVIHLHNLHANYINLPMLLKYCAARKIKTMLTLHDCWFFTGKCFHFRESGCEKYMDGCEYCPRKKMDIPNYFWDRSKVVWKDRKNLFQAIPDLKVVGCSEWISRRASESLIFSDKEVFTIRNGIDLTIFCQQERSMRNSYDIENRFVILGMASKWLQKENESVFKHIYENLDSDSVIVMVGCDDAQKQKLQAYDKIISLGYISDRKELAEIYSMADVFVNLSLVDTLPTVNMESIACGTPVICYDQTGGGPELVINGRTGYVIPQLDYEALKTSLIKVKMGTLDRDECAQIALQEFSKQQKYMQYVMQYIKWVER